MAGLSLVVVMGRAAVAVSIFTYLYQTFQRAKVFYTKDMPGFRGEQHGRYAAISTPYTSERHYEGVISVWLFIFLINRVCLVDGTKRPDSYSPNSAAGCFGWSCLTFAAPLDVYQPSEMRTTAIVFRRLHHSPVFACGLENGRFCHENKAITEANTRRS
jgi:hypothetical protein